MFESKDIGLQLLQSTRNSLVKIGMTLAILKMPGKIPIENDLLTNSA